MDGTVIPAVLGSIKTAIEIANFINKSGLSLDQAETKLKLAELIRALADSKLEIVEAQGKLTKAEARIHELEQQLEVRQVPEWRDPFYWIKTEEGAEGPFCQKCYDSEKKLVRLLDQGDNCYECKVCKSRYLTLAHRERQAASIRKFTERKRGPYY
jgi:hypothetical protein